METEEIIRYSDRFHVEIFDFLLKRCRIDNIDNK